MIQVYELHPTNCEKWWPSPQFTTRVVSDICDAILLLVNLPIRHANRTPEGTTKYTITLLPQDIYLPI